MGDYGAYAVLVKHYFQEKFCVANREVPSPALKHLGDNIRRMRMAKGITQQQLAELAELNIRNVQRIEAGKIDVLFSTAARIKKALDCTWESLIPRDWR